MRRSGANRRTPSNSEERSSSTNSLETEFLPAHETRVADYTEELENKFQSFLLRLTVPGLQHQRDLSEANDDSVDPFVRLQTVKEDHHQHQEEEEDNLLSSGTPTMTNLFHLNLDELNKCDENVTRGDNLSAEFAKERLEENIQDDYSPQCPLFRRGESPFVSLSEDILKPLSQLDYTTQENSHFYQINESTMNKQRSEWIVETEHLHRELEEMKRENLMLSDHAKTLEKDLQSSQQQTLEMQKRHESIINSLQDEQKKLLNRIDQLSARENSSKSQICSPFNNEKVFQTDNFQEQINQLHYTMEEFREDKEALRKQIDKYEERLQNIVRIFESREPSRDSGIRSKNRSPIQVQETKLSETLEGNEMVNALRQELPKAFRHAENLQKDMEMAIKNLQTVEENIKTKLVQQERKMEETLRQRQSEWFEKTKANQEECLQKLQESEKKVLQLTNQLKEKEIQEGEEKLKFAQLQEVLSTLQQRILREINQECRNMKMALGVETKLERNNSETVPEVSPTEICEALANLRAHSRELCKLVNDLTETNDHLNDQMRSLEHDLPVKENERITETQEQWMRQWKEKVKNIYSRKIKLLHMKQQQATKQLVDVHQKELSQMEMRIRHWKETMVETMASRLQKEFQEKFESRLSEITAAQLKVPVESEEKPISTNRKDIQHSKSEKKKIDSSEAPLNVEVLHELRNVIQQLREENISLRKLLTGSASKQSEKFNSYEKDLISDKHGSTMSPAAPSPNLSISRKV